MSVQSKVQTKLMRCADDFYWLVGRDSTGYINKSDCMEAYEKLTPRLADKQHDESLPQ